jgi:hypothetical protein
MTWRGVGFPMLRNNIVAQFESAIVLQPAAALSMFEINIWGMVFYSVKIDQNESGTDGILLYRSPI